MSRTPCKEDRNSGIELLKVISIFLIVVFHVISTLRTESPYAPNHDYVVDISVATISVRDFVLSLFTCFGPLGNTIFFVCSAWFLLRSQKCNKQKSFLMLSEIWFISVAFLVIMFVTRRGDISGKIIIKSLMPTTFSSNWYLTCYLLFYAIHPLLNSVIQKMSKQQLFRISVAMTALYFGFCFIYSELFFSSYIITWIAIYFVMAYIQLYMVDFSSSLKQNVALLLIGCIAFVGMAVITNIFGLKIPALRDKLLYWNTNHNPFLIAMAIALFNCMRRLRFKSRFVNYVSRLSFLIYIIHENIALRTYVRPLMWDFIYRNYGYNHLIPWVFALAAIVFLFGLSCAVLYDRTLRRVIYFFSNKLYEFICRCYTKVEERLLKLH